MFALIFRSSSSIRERALYPCRSKNMLFPESKIGAGSVNNIVLVFRSIPKFILQRRILVTSVMRGMRKIKLVFNMGLKPALKNEPPADRRAAQWKAHRVRRAARA